MYRIEEGTTYEIIDTAHVLALGNEHCIPDILPIVRDHMCPSP